MYIRTIGRQLFRHWTRRGILRDIYFDHRQRKRRKRKYRRRPRPHPESHVYYRPMTFKLKKNHYFEIRDKRGRTRYKVTDSLFSLREGKTLTTVDGLPLFTVKHTLKSTRGKRKVIDAETGQVVFTLKRRSARPGKGRSIVLVWDGEDNDEPVIICKGNVRRTVFVIREAHSNMELAVVKWNVLTIRTVVGRSVTYKVQTQPGVNAALMIMLALAIDSIYTVPIIDEATKELQALAL